MAPLRGYFWHSALQGRNITAQGEALRSFRAHKTVMNRAMDNTLR